MAVLAQHRRNDQTLSNAEARATCRSLLLTESERLLVAEAYEKLKLVSIYHQLAFGSEKPAGSMNSAI